MPKFIANLIRPESPLSVFRYRDFTFAWGSTSLVTMGTQMEAVVLGWFILTLTDSPFLVGAISAARMAMNIMALFAGAIADRVPRHRLLAVVEFIMAGFAALMLVLILSGQLETWHIFAVAVVAGMVRVFQMPAAQSLVADTLPPDRIANGAAFNNLGRNIAMLLGPLFGGVLFNSFGAKGAYIAIAALYIMSGWVAIYIRSSGQKIIEKKDGQVESVFRTMIGGLKYVKSNQILWGTLALALVIESSGWTFHTTLMPIFARDVLDVDSTGLGFLLFAFGVGAVAASLGWAMISNLRHVGKLMIASVVFWHASILLFATSDSFYLSMAILTLTGAGFASTQVFLLSSVLGNSRPEFRVRVISLRSLAIYAFALGSMSSGLMAGLWSAPVAANIVGVMGIILVLLLAVVAPKLRRL
ncbi:MAG: MFS transporter [Dehalococcoidia bacterium]|nr:MFS transporter [Dehalococcoidia bacterium]